MTPSQPAAQDCIDACRACNEECLRALSTHCLVAGGPHADAAHLRLMLCCAEVCRAAAFVMTLGDPRQHELCAVCARFCDACAEDCERLGGMEACVAACRACAQACRGAAGGGRHHAALSDRVAAEATEGAFVRPAGPGAMRDPPRDWRAVDEASDQSFPASDPPSTY